VAATGVQDSVSDGDRHREPLPRHPARAQDEDGGFGLHARVRRGAGQGRGHHRHGKGLEPVRLRQRRREARHADLLASDLDDKTLIRFIDRFLMFYIRTGDRLQRTATWLENLEGGVDYVRKVVCEDSLGIGAELEADMQKLVDTSSANGRRRSTIPRS